MKKVNYFKLNLLIIGSIAGYLTLCICTLVF